MGNSLYFSIKGGVLTRLDSETEIRPGTGLRFSFEDNWGTGAKLFALFRGAADGTYYGQALVNNMCTIPVCMVERAKFFVSVSTGIEETNPVEIRNRAVDGPVTAEELREMMQKLNEAGSAADAVRYSAQELNDAQKEQARTNIGAAAVGEGGGGVDVPDNVLTYDTQTLTPEQQAQARANIGAAEEGEGGLIVTVTGNTASHTAEEIANHVKTGGTAVLKRGEDLYNFVNYSEDTGAAYFMQIDPMDAEYFERATVDGNSVIFYTLPFALDKDVVKTVNGVEPDENGNVDVAGAGMVVTVDNNVSSKSSAEIAAHVKTGGSVALKRGEDLYSFIYYSEDTGAAYFIQVDPMDGEYFEITYVSGNKVIFYKMPFANGNEVVKTVNGAKPDENGNVEVVGGSGEDGFSPIATVERTETGAIVTITDKDGTTTAEINDGKDGVSVDHVEDPQDGTMEVYDTNGRLLGVVTLPKGKDGDDGVSPSVGISKVGKATTIEITDADGTQTETIIDGEDGKDGTSVTVSNVSESSASGGTNTVTFSDGKKLNVKNGKDGAPGKTPVKGEDYFTAADKEEMVKAVIAALPVYNGEVR